jgi:hypothetical protein
MSIQQSFYILFFVLFAITVQAQTDTSYQVIREEEGAMSTTRVETAQDRAFRTMEPVKWAFKLDGASLIGVGNSGISQDGSNLNLNAEYKLSPAFSINAGYAMAFSYQSAFANFEAETSVRVSALSLEGRWYHDMQRRIREGRSANNIGGRYVGLEGVLLNSLPSINSGYFDQKQFNLRYGVQQRLLKNGFFDVSMGVGAGSSISVLKQNPWSFSTDQRLTIGLGIFRPGGKNMTSTGSTCDILHCFDEQYKMLKINLFDVLNFSTNSWFTGFDFKPSLSYEQKLGRSAFSVEGTIGARYNYTRAKVNVWNGSTTFSTGSSVFEQATIDAQAELRWYYDMKKRILRGKSGNNLSGGFVAVQLGKESLLPNIVYYKAPQTITNSFGPLNLRDYAEANIVWGYQQRLLDRGFIQFKIGPGIAFGGHNYQFDTENTGYTKSKRSVSELNLVAELKAGFAF